MTRTAALFSKEPAEVSPQEIRSTLEKTSNKLSRKFQNLLVSQAPAVVKEIQKQAARHKIDPLYVGYIFVRPTRFWPTMSPKQKNALEIAQAILTESHSVPSFGKMEIPPIEMEPATNAALIGVADWVLKVLIPHLRKEYYKSVDAMAKPHIRILRSDPSMSPLVDAGSQISGHFRRRVETGREMSPLRFLMLQVLSAI